MLVHTYPPLLSGNLVKRYKRFFADIELETGEMITAHCANTGPMTGISTIGSQVYVSHDPSPKRKLKYSWQMIEVDQTWVGVNTNLPNKVIRHMLQQRLLPELEPYENVAAEVAYGNEGSRIDFVLSSGATQSSQQSKLPKSPKSSKSSKKASKSAQDKDRDRTNKIYVEVKNTTWSKGSLALFPDTVTTRGQKHIRELMSVITKDSQAVLLYFINRGDCDKFAPGDDADREYGKLLRNAIAKGLKVLPCRFHVTPTGIEYLGLAELEILSRSNNLI